MGGVSAGLQLPSKHESLLAEMLFSQMLRVPQSQLKPLAYSTLMVRPAASLLHKGHLINSILLVPWRTLNMFLYRVLRRWGVIK